MRKNRQIIGPKKSTIDKILAFSKSLSHVKNPQLNSKINYHLN